MLLVFYIYIIEYCFWSRSKWVRDIYWLVVELGLDFGFLIVQVNRGFFYCFVLLEWFNVGMGGSGQKGNVEVIKDLFIFLQVFRVLVVELFFVI